MIYSNIHIHTYIDVYNRYTLSVNPPPRMARSYPFRISSLTFTVGNLHFLRVAGGPISPQPTVLFTPTTSFPGQISKWGFPQNSEWILSSSEATWHLNSLTFKGRCIFEMMVFFHCYVSLPEQHHTPPMPLFCSTKQRWHDAGQSYHDEDAASEANLWREQNSAQGPALQRLLEWIHHRAETNGFS